MKKCYVKFDARFIFSRVFFTLAVLMLIMALPPVVSAQGLNVTGSVKDEKGQPLIGVTIIIKGTANGTVTDIKGAYTIKNVAKDAQLQFSSIGYDGAEIAVGGRSVIDVVLKEASTSLDEVIVVGYGTMKKKDLTGAIASVDGAKIINRQTSTVSQALQGAMPGVTVTRTNSAPGAEATIRVRGITSIKESDPLVIIDGVPGSLGDINPQDIESISVLKDAASASIYGARAAAGVVLVTTRRAKVDGVSVSYAYSLSLDIPTAMPEFTDAVGYMKAHNELTRNDNAADGDYPIYSKDKIDNWNNLHRSNPDLYPNTDWVDMCLDKLAPRHSHQLSISSGGAKRKSNISFGYDDVEGLFKKNLSWQRFTVRANNDVTVNKWLSTSLDINFRKTDSVNPFYSPSGSMRYAAPIYPAVWSDGRLAGGKTGTNPYGKMMYGGTKRDEAYQMGGKMSVDIKPVKGLVISGVFSPKFNFSKSKDFNIAVPYTNLDAPEGGSNLFLDGANTTDLKETRADSYSFTGQLFANYTLSLNRHNISVMGGYEEYKYHWENIYASRGQYTMSDYPFISAGPSEFQGTGNEPPKENGYRSYFGRVMYNYDSRYYIQANVRYDGSSRFHKDYRWGTFPSVSAGWVVSQEKFMQDVKVISFFKLRGSWGQLGNERIGDYPYQSTLSFQSPVMYPGGGGGEIKPVQGASAWQYSVRDISWETTETYDIGLDLNLFDNRMHFSGDYYKKSTSGMLLQVEIPNFMGYTNPYQNAGKMHTKGWDVELGWSDKVGELHYSVSVNLSDYRSMMGTLKGTEFPEGGKITKEGYEYNSWYGYLSNGLYQHPDQLLDSPKTSDRITTGDIWYKDISGPDGVPDGSITAYDRVPLGGSLPRYNFGATINLEYRGFDLNVVIQGVGKRTALLDSQMVQPIRADWYNVPLFVDRSHWSIYNTVDQNMAAKYPRYSKTSESNNYSVSDYWLLDGAYTRIKNITVGYSLPQRWMKKILFSSARVYVSLNDFFTFSHFPKGWDPEVSSTGYPITKSVVIGASIGF